MTTEAPAKNRLKWIAAGIAAVALLIGAFALERASRKWVPNAEKRVREAQLSGQIGTDGPDGSIPPSPVQKSDPLVDVAAVAAAAPKDPEAQLAYARECTKVGAFMRAIRPAEAAIGLRPDDANTRLLLGMLYATQGYLSRAEMEYAKAIELDPKLLEAYLRYGQLMGASKRPGEEEKLYRKAMSIAPELDGPRISLASFLLNRGQHDEAISVLEPLIAQVKPNPGVLLLAGKVFQGRGRVDRAESMMKLLLTIQPDMADAHHILGSLLSNRGATRDGIMEMQRATELDPDNSNYWYALGNALRGDAARAGALPEASAAFERALETDPSSSFAHYYYGLTLEDLGDLPAAEREYRRTLELEPTFGSAKHRLGSLCKATGRVVEGDRLLAQFAKEARGAIREVHGGRRDNSFVDTASAQYARGMRFLNQGERAKAVLAFREALKRDPRFSSARRQLQSMGEAP